MLETAESNRSRGESRPLLATGVVFMGVLCLGSFVAREGPRVYSPRSLDYAEGWTISTAADAQPLELDEPPYTTRAYGPGVFLLHGAIAKAFGLQWPKTAVAARMVTLFFTLGTVALVTLAGVQLGARASLAFLAAALPLASPGLLMFGVNPRPDAPGLFMVSLAVVAIVAARPRWIFAGICIGLALGLKHSYVALPLGVGIVLLASGQVRALLRVVAASVAVVVGVFLVGFWIYGASSFQGLLLQGFLGADFKQAVYFVGTAVSEAPAAFCLPWFGWAVTAKGQRSHALLATAFVMSGVLQSAAMAKPGACTNYLLETVWLGAPLAAFGLTRLLDAAPAGRIQFATLAALGVCAVPGLVLSANQTIDTARSLAAERDENIGKTTEEFAAKLDGPVLSDTAEIYLSLQKPFFNFPPDLTKTAFEHGALDGLPGETLIRQRHFAAIIVMATFREGTFLPRPWIDAIDDAYEPTGELLGLTVLTPKTASDEAPPAGR